MDRFSTLINASLAVQRAVALLILLLILCLFSAFSILVFNSLKSGTDEIVEKRITLGRLESVAALGSTLKENSGNNQPSGSGKEFFEGSSEAVILADLQSRLNRTAASHSITVESVGNLPIRTKDNVKFAGVGTEVQGTNEAIHSLLFDIETSTPYLVIRDLTLRSFSNGAQTEGEPQLVARIEFFGALPPSQFGGASE